MQIRLKCASFTDFAICGVTHISRDQEKLYNKHPDIKPQKKTIREAIDILNEMNKMKNRGQII